MHQKEQFPSVKTLSPDQLAKRHGVSKEQILQQLKMGIGVEQEHTKDPDQAREIALDHLKELPDYYTRLKKMEESDIRDILHRSGVQEAKRDTRDLDKFENLITDIALRLIDEDDDMDPATAGMDILDAVNDRIMTESVRRKAGTWYDPMIRALEILEDELPEDILANVRDKLDAYSNDYISGYEGEEEDCGCEAEEVSMQDMVDGLTQAGFHLDRDGLMKLDAVIQSLLQMQEAAGHSIEMRIRQYDEDELELRKRAGLTEACACELMDDTGMDSGMAEVLRQVIPEIRGIAMHYVTDKASKQRLGEIAEQLSGLQNKVNGMERS